VVEHGRRADLAADPESRLAQPVTDMQECRMSGFRYSGAIGFVLALLNAFRDGHPPAPWCRGSSCESSSTP
jgi:hypothetical protein